MSRNYLREPKVKWSEELRATIRGLGMVIRAAPLFVAGVFSLSIIQGVTPAIMVYAVGRFITYMDRAIVDGPDSAAAAGAYRTLVIFGVAVLASQIVGPIQGAIRFGLEKRFQAYLSQRIISAVTGLPGLAYFEDPEFRDKLEVSTWIGWAPVQSVSSIIQVVQSGIQLLSMAALTALYAKWAPVVIVLTALPEAVVSWKTVSRSGMRRLRNTDEARKASYYRRMGLTLEPAKEIRIFGIGKWIRQRQASHWLAGVKEMWAEQKRSLIIQFGMHVVAIGGLGYVFVRMVADTLGGFDVGRFTASFQGAFGMGNMLLALFSTLARVRQTNFYMPTAMKLIDLHRADPRLDISGRLPAQGLPRTGITFQNVSFTYPATSRQILKNLDLHIEPGQSVALVGENGAGKTTLIKLLCRFYDPDEGRIFLDGVDIKDFDLAGLRTRLAVIFQDFVRYMMPAQDNVGFGALNKRDDIDAVREAARRVGVLDRVEAMPSGWDTPLAREFGGVDISGGEWQRIALARAMMAQIGRDADLLILDEPTASLDVRLEHELYTHFAELSKGRTTLLVSHRFSTVRMASRIIFLADGKICEDGTHEALIEANGRYAELYEMQASHFRTSEAGL